MANTYINMTQKSAQVGLGQSVFLAPISEFQAFGVINDAASTDPGATVIVDTNHTFAVGKGFAKAYTTQDFSEMTGEAVGEKDCETMNFKLKFFMPGSDAELSEFADKAKSDRFILLVKDPNCDNGNVYQCGTDCSPASIKPMFGTGTIKGGKKGWEFEAEWTGKLLFYTGTITVKA